MTLPFDISAIAPELWTRVIELLEPPAMLALSKTCKHLRKLSMDRNVWVREIRTMCLERGLFSPSYPVDDMDISQLQRAAMAPYLCEDLFQSHTISLLDDGEPKSVEPASEINLDFGDSRTSHHHLVPGGRFLITGGSHLRVWDLGVPGDAALAPPVLISSLELGEWGEMWSMSVSVIGGRSLRIAVMVGVFSLVVYDICLDHERPALRLLPGMISPPEHLQDIYGWSAELNGNRALLSTLDNTFILWDYVARRYTLWTIVMTREDWHTNQIVFFGDLLVAISPQSLKVWLAPTPDRPCNAPITRTAFGPNDPTPCPPDITINLPAIDGVAAVEGAIMCPQNWDPQSGDPLTFDILYKASPVKETLRTLARYQLAVTFHDDTGPAPISADLQLTGTFNFMGRFYYGSYHTFSRHIPGYSIPITVHKGVPGDVYACQADSGQIMHYCVYSVASIPVESGHSHSTREVSARTAVRLTLLQSVGYPHVTRMWSLCASSGRLVLLGYRDKRRTGNMAFIRSYLY